MNLFLIKKDEDFNLVCKIFIKILMLFTEAIQLYYFSEESSRNTNIFKK